MVQDVVPFLAGGDLDKLAQEERSALGDGGQFAYVLGLALQAVDLPTQETRTWNIMNDSKCEYWTGKKTRRLATDHHLLHDGVTAQDVVLARVFLDKVFHPGRLT